MRLRLSPREWRVLEILKIEEECGSRKISGRGRGRRWRSRCDGGQVSCAVVRAIVTRIHIKLREMRVGEIGALELVQEIPWGRDLDRQR